MITEPPADLGAQLARLRNRAQMTQAALAARLGVDQSRISRIENADTAPTREEIYSYLQGLGTAEGRALEAYLKMDWELLSPPSAENPDVGAVWQIEQELRRLAEFEDDRNPPKPVRAEIAMHRQSLEAAADYLTRLEHQFAFIGPVGIGKTTGLCLAAELTVTSPNPGLADRIALETGGGRVTLCEVGIKAGPAWGILVEPYPEAEIYRLVADLCEGLGASAQPDAADDAPKGIPSEFDRALRNMAGLARRSEKLPDGKRRYHDPAAELARTTATTDDLRVEFASRLALWRRTRKEFWHEEDQLSSPTDWLRRRFAKINKGQVDDVSLPRRIEVLVPRPVLDETLRLSLLDTRGVDETAIRPDLRACLDDPRTLIILCSAFNSAPDAAIQRFLTQAVETGSRRALAERTAILILPRPGEATAMKDDAGEPVETADDGCDIKAEQVQNALKRLGLDDEIPILFFNAVADDPSRLRKALLDVARRARGMYLQRLHGVSAAIDRLITNYELTAAVLVRKEVNKRLHIFLKQNRTLVKRMYPAHDRLLTAVTNTNARTIWATTRRQGTWYNFDVYLHLGAGEAAEATRRSGHVLAGLEGLIENMLGTDDLEVAHPFLREVLANASVWAEHFVDVAQRLGQETFRPALQDDASVWSECEDRWGGGPPYRQDIAGMLRKWFSAPEREQLHRTLEKKLQQAWKEHVVEPLQKLCMEADAAVSGAA